MRALLLLAVLFAFSPAHAQEGTAVYEITTQLDIELPPELAHMADQFPSSQTEKKVLHFRDAVSVMKAAPREEEPQDFESGGMRIMFRQSDDESLHLDREAGTRTERREFLSRTFLIDGEPDDLAWQLTGDAAEFLGYTAYKATTMRDTVAVEAWFTPEIPVMVGPGPYGGLPGLILVVTEDEGRRTYIAQKVTLEPLEEDALEPPTDGRRVTQEEFDAIVEEKMEEMGRGRRGGIFIRR